MAICNRVRSVFAGAMLLALSGCGADLGGPGNGPFGAPAQSRLLAPFAGDWVFDFEKTLDAQKAAGATDEQIESLRKLYAENPQFGKMHPDMTIAGNEAACSGSPAAEYRLFGMHEHGPKVCGKAWHHEDRFDPGDMSKCYVRLRVEDDRLYFETRMKDGLPDVNDPDLRSSPPAEGSSAAECDANSPAGKDWSEWTTFVFVRKP
ncbi:MAG: hypothetical protein ACM3U2_09100 [Deltaproteobacteria bacterium]